MDIYYLDYYRTKDTGKIAKGDGCHYWIYQNGEWIDDTENIILKELCENDSSERKGSLYGF